MSFSRWPGATALVAVLLLVACGGGSGGTSAATSKASASQNIPGVQVELASSRAHRQGHIDYPGKLPPSGGPHNPVPLTCGFYATQPPTENGVHSLEHGAVWIAFGPSLAVDEVGVLKAFAKQDHVIVSPYAGMDTPITLVAWEHRLELTSVADPRLAQFVQAFANAPTAPEPGYPCAGVGQPSQ